MEKKEERLKLNYNSIAKSLFNIFLIASLTVFLFHFIIAAPEGPSSVTNATNETKSTVGSYMFNISGGYISTFNLTATTQNPRWKAMVGQVSGSFTLDDSTGATIYDWSLTTIAGEVYATRNSSTITWNNLTCASVTTLEAENTALSHTNKDDNLTATFNITTGATHAEFFVASRNITENSCPTLNTYKNSNPQDADFEEVALYEFLGGNIIYATILESNVAGFDNVPYDFQMIVPENGAEGWEGSTAYYLYVELS